MARDFKHKGEIIGSIVISINHKGRVAGVEIKGQGDLCTRQTLKSAMFLADIAIMHARSKRKRSGLDKMKADRIEENKIAKDIEEARIAKESKILDVVKKEDPKVVKEVKRIEVKPATKFITKKKDK